MSKFGDLLKGKSEPSKTKSSAEATPHGGEVDFGTAIERIIDTLQLREQAAAYDQTLLKIGPKKMAAAIIREHEENHGPMDPFAAANIRDDCSVSYRKLKKK